MNVAKTPFAPATGSQPRSVTAGGPDRNEAARRSQPAEPPNVAAVLNRKIIEARSLERYFLKNGKTNIAARKTEVVQELLHLRRELFGTPLKAQPAVNRLLTNMQHKQNEPK